MVVRILGSAAGGGFPQWNCNCRVCTAARNGHGRALPRTQSSIAVRAEAGPWYLVNASPDLRPQLAEIDHTAGLLLMRESSVPLRVYSSEAVRRALTDHYPVLTMLDRYCGVEWSRLDPGERILLDDVLEVEAFSAGGDPPLYMDGAGAETGVTASGLTIHDGETGGVLTYAPALEAIDDEITERLRASDYVAIDGTFWSADELVSLGLAERDAYAMGHVPLTGPAGSLATLQELPGKAILLHVNNTNPILLDDSEERALVAASGVEVAYDGMEIRL